MQAFLALFYSIVMAFERRWLGGGFKDKIGKVSRIWKNILYVGILLAMYFTSGRTPETWLQLAAMVWVIAWTVRYYNHTHGDYYHLEDTQPDEERSWWVGKVLKAIFGKGKYYNFVGNFIGLTLGYLVPALFASIFMPHHWFWIAGFTTPLCYVACRIWLGKLANNTYAEWTSGFFMGIIFYLNLL